jgi:hypothetical protein
VPIFLLRLLELLHPLWEDFRHLLQLVCSLLLRHQSRQLLATTMAANSAMGISNTSNRAETITTETVNKINNSNMETNRTSNRNNHNNSSNNHNNSSSSSKMEGTKAGTTRHIMEIITTELVAEVRGASIGGTNRIDSL